MADKSLLKNCSTFADMTKGQKKGEPAPMRVFEMYEHQIIPMVAEGYNYQEIAERLPPLNEKLIIHYVQKILQKWGAKNRPNLIHLWHEKKLTSSPDRSPLEELLPR